VRSYETALKILAAHPCPLIEWKILNAMADLLRSPRQSARAAAIRDRALKLSLAESIADEKLQHGFLAGQARGVVA
jgi:hypothetical protein